METSSIDRLVEDLLGNILSRLSDEEIARSRSVCKCWYAASTCPGFFVQPNREVKPWVVRLNNKERKLWRPFSQTGIKETCLRTPRLGLTPFSSFGGLVAGIVHCDYVGNLFYNVVDDVLLVGNPVTNQWQHIPRPSDIPQPLRIESMRHDFRSGRTQIALATQRPGVPPALDISQYDSSTGKWSPGQSISGNELVLATGCVIVEDVTEAFYDLERMEWTQRPIEGPVFKTADVEGWPGCRCVPVQAFSYRGDRVLLAQMTVPDENDKHVGVAVWKRDEEEMRWSLLSSLRFEDLGWTHWMRASPWWHGFLIGDVAVFDCVPPVAFHLVDKEWEIGVTDKEIEWLQGERTDVPGKWNCIYAFAPSLRAAAEVSPIALPWTPSLED